MSLDLLASPASSPCGPPSARGNHWQTLECSWNPLTHACPLPLPPSTISSVLAAQSCPTFCNPTDCSLPGSSIHGLLQARILECIAIPFSTSLLCHVPNSSLFKLRISTILLEGLEWRPSLLLPPLCPSPSHTGVQRSGYDSVFPTGLRIPYGQDFFFLAARTVFLSKYLLSVISATENGKE